MTRSTRTSSLLVACAILAAAGCGPPLSRLPREGDLHPRITRFAYIEEGKLVSLIVDTEATRQREGSAFVPLGVGVANLGLKRITLTRESFTLADDEGRRYSMATVAEARTLGSAMIRDRRLSQQFVGVFASRFAPWPSVDSAFFPQRSGEPGRLAEGIARDEVPLTRYSWMVDVVYFPHPEGALLGRRFELWLDAEELEEPVFVKLRVR